MGQGLSPGDYLTLQSGWDFSDPLLQLGLRSIRGTWDSAGREPVFTKERLESGNQMLLQGERSLAAWELWVGRLQSVKDKWRDVETGSLFFLSWAGFFRPLSGLYWGCLSGEVSWNQIDSHLDGCDIICLLQSYWTVVTNWEGTAEPPEVSPAGLEEWEC